MNFSEEQVYDALSLFALTADSDGVLLSFHGATSIAD